MTGPDIKPSEEPRPIVELVRTPHDADQWTSSRKRKEAEFNQLYNIASDLEKKGWKIFFRGLFVGFILSILLSAIIWGIFGG